MSGTDDPANAERALAFLEALPHPVTLRDEEGCYRYVNPAFERDTGIAAEDIIGVRANEAFPPGDARHDVEASGERAEVFDEQLEAPTPNIRYIFRCISTPTARPAGTGTLRLDVTRNARTERILEVAASTAHLHGEDGLLRQCVRDMSAVYHNQTSMITVFADDAHTALKTLAVWNGEDWGENFTYDIAGTPCEDVLARRVEVIEKDVADAYPDDEDLRTYGVESYCAVPMETGSGEILGLVSTLDDRPIPPDAIDRRLLRIYATRIALELERERAQATCGAPRQPGTHRG